MPVYNLSATIEENLPKKERADESAETEAEE